jgi:hypothetical protein
MSRKSWLFDAENVPELEDYSDQKKTADNGWSDWESHSEGDDALFEVPASRGSSGYRRSREELLRHHLRWRREHSHGHR